MLLSDYVDFGSRERALRILTENGFELLKNGYGSIVPRERSPTYPASDLGPNACAYLFNGGSVVEFPTRKLPELAEAQARIRALAAASN